ncbi:MipA/OmpV family protein [Sphingomonas bacterium]|uniref:MipA/OmpV family protein n=1 Tax=Sphingomonas bacterium TaxID=1895847 RepID=UPI0034A01FB9
MRRSTLMTFAAALAAAASPALAQDANTPPSMAGGQATDFGDHTTIGVGAVYLPDYEGSNNYRVEPAPLAIGAVKGFAFALIGNRLSIDLIRDPKDSKYDFQLGPIGVVDFNRDNSHFTDARVRALGKVGTAIELGGYAGIGKTGVITSPYDKLTASLSYRYDVSNVHNSGILQPSINYLAPLSRKLAVGLFASAEHAGRGYATSYYTVSPAQSAASGLPVYYADAGWKDVSVGAVATVSITGDLLHGFKLVGGGTYTRLMNGFADSPVVSIAGSRDQWIGALGVAYTF